MKTILLLAVLALLAGCNGGNEDKTTRPQMPIKIIQRNGKLLHACINGYQFFLLEDYNSFSMTQIWERTPEGPQPAQCQPLQELPQGMY